MLTSLSLPPFNYIVINFLTFSLFFLFLIKKSNLHKNKSTDILSFPFNKNFKISKQTYIGDIIISYNFINKPKSQTVELFKKKLIKIFIHGFLHLLNFDHVKNKDYKKMLKEEELIYQSVISKLN